LGVAQAPGFPLQSFVKPQRFSKPLRFDKRISISIPNAVALHGQFTRRPKQIKDHTTQRDKKSDFVNLLLNKTPILTFGNRLAYICKN
jgi:hypothetical protein